MNVLGNYLCILNAFKFLHVYKLQTGFQEIGTSSQLKVYSSASTRNYIHFYYITSYMYHGV